MRSWPASSMRVSGPRGSTYVNGTSFPLSATHDGVPLKRNGSYATNGTLDVSTGLDGVNPVHFDATFSRSAAGQVTLTLSITNCPYHWGKSVIYGS